MSRTILCILIICLSFGIAQTPAIELEPILEGFELPVYATHAEDGSGRLFVVSLAGRVFVLQDGELLPEPFLDLAGIVTAQEGEQGLFSVAFHPEYATNRQLYVAYTEAETGELVVMAHETLADNPNRADPQGEEIIRFDPIVPYHHGGQLEFGPDGYLYISFGDGTGPLFEPTPDFKRAQNLNELGGKILRLDVDAPADGLPYGIPADNPFVTETSSEEARAEVYALGFRNPWKFSFDRETGELYTSDVGNYDWEEINRVEVGENYGWPIREGPVCFVFPETNELAYPDCTEFEDLSEPLLRYGHAAFDNEGGNAIVGGYVYRGEAYPELRGLYFYADFTNGRIWATDPDAPTATADSLLLDTDYAITSFAEDEAGELYVTAISGELFRIIAQ